MSARRSLTLTGDPDTWSGWLGELSGAGPRDTPEYLALATLLEPARPCCARFESDAGVVLLPFLRREIPGAPGLTDITSPYDFGGHLIAPRSPGGDTLLLREFLKTWEAWCLEERIVSEFLRLHPFRFPSRSVVELPDFATLHQPHVVVRLSPDLAEVRKSYSASCRRNVRRARDAGVRVDLGERSEETAARFYQLYSATMTRRRAPRFYFFPQRFFTRLITGVSQARVLEAWQGGQLQAAMILLADEKDVFYFLGASDDRSWPLRPNNALFDVAIEWAGQSGFRRLHLGGGAPELLRYKFGYSPATVPYYVRRKIHLESISRDLSSTLTSGSAPLAERSSFPPYRP